MVSPEFSSNTETQTFLGLTKASILQQKCVTGEVGQEDQRTEYLYHRIPKISKIAGAQKID